MSEQVNTRSVLELRNLPFIKLFGQVVEPAKTSVAKPLEDASDAASLSVALTPGVTDESSGVNQLGSSSRSSAIPQSLQSIVAPSSTSVERPSTSIHLDAVNSAGMEHGKVEMQLLPAALLAQKKGLEAALAKRVQAHHGGAFRKAVGNLRSNDVEKVERAKAELEEIQQLRASKAEGLQAAMIRHNLRSLEAKEARRLRKNEKNRLRIRKKKNEVRTSRDA